MDHWSETFAIFGTGSGHTSGCTLRVCSPNHNATHQSEPGIETVAAPPSLVWIILRIGIKTPSDLTADMKQIRALQSATGIATSSSTPPPGQVALPKPAQLQPAAPRPAAAPPKVVRA